MSRRKVELVECDNPGCSVAQVDDGIDPVAGYHFDANGGRVRKGVVPTVGVVHHGGGGYPIPTFYACSLACVTPALEARINEQNDPEWEGER